MILRFRTLSPVGIEERMVMVGEAGSLRATKQTLVANLMEPCSEFFGRVSRRPISPVDYLLCICNVTFFNLLKNYSQDVRAHRDHD